MYTKPNYVCILPQQSDDVQLSYKKGPYMKNTDAPTIYGHVPIWPSVVSAKKLDFRSRQLSFVPNGKGSILVSAKYNHIRFVPVCFMNSVEIELPITGDNNNFIVHRP